MSQRVTQEDIADILGAFGNSHFAHFELSVGSVRIAANRATASERDPSSRTDAPVSRTEQVIAPLLGMFQAGLEPRAPALVAPGTKVESDTTVGFIRVMQNLTPVRAGLSGVVVEVLVQDSQFVEFGQTLLQVRLVNGGGDAR